MALCVQCSFDNPPGMRFCGNCGARMEARLDIVAPGPVQPSPSPVPETISMEQVGSMVGADLLERFQKAGLEATGQRRNVTVLFADLSGYTDLSAKLEAEDVYELIQEFIRLLIGEVYKYEGIVDKLTGDGLMALFGAPISNENNAERAIRAALDMQAGVTELSCETKARYGHELHMRVGLHAGSVVVGGIGSNLIMNYTAIGDTVNLANRLEEAAEAGSIQVSEAVYRQTRRIFDYSPAQKLSLKGIAQPITAYQVVGIKATPGSVRGLEGLRSPMIGRDQELSQLKSAASALVNRKAGRYILVTGEGGIGKSRLTAELKTSLGSMPIRVLEGSSLTYRRSLSYWIFLDLMRNYLGAQAVTSDADLSRKLVQAAYQALGKRAAELLPYLENFLSLPPSNLTASERLHYLDAGQLRQQTFLALRDLLIAEAQRRPLFMILEDLHWADEASLELLTFLLDAVRQAPIIIYTISRPFQGGGLGKIEEWAGKYLADRFESIRLQSLSLDQSNNLLLSLLPVSEFPEDLRRYILEQASGVPFYLEEILRMLIDGGVLVREGAAWRIASEVDTGSLGVPDTLQGLILARFDRLGEAQRRILQTAAVIGHQFSQRLLEALLLPTGESNIESTLNQLVEREFIIRLSEHPATAYAFRHMLMSEAIYGTLLKRERARLHGQVGEAIEALYADRLDEQVELLARHYSWSPRLDRALHYAILAGKKSAASYVNEPAQSHFQQALELLPKVQHTASQALQVHTGLGDVQVLVGDYASAYKHYQTALATFELEDMEAQAQEISTLQRKSAKILERQGEYEQALKRLESARQLLDRSPEPSPVEQAQILNDTGWIIFRKGNFVEAERLLQQALALVENSTAYDAIASIYNRLGGIAYNQGDWNRTADYLRKSIAIREAIGDLVGLATSFNNLGLLGIEMGDFDNALENLTHSYELKTRLGQAEGISMALNNMGWLRIQRGELDEANQCLNQALDLARQIGFSSLKREILKNFGEMYLAAQDWTHASQVLSEAVQLLSDEDAGDQRVDSYRLMGESALGSGDLETAQSCADKIQALVASLSDDTSDLSTIERGEYWRFLGMLATHKGEWELASGYLKISEKIFQSLGSRLHQGRAAYLLGALAEAQGELRSAHLRYREAALLFRSVGARLEQRRSEEAYQRSN